ncbi:MAG TPA: hypothetical protein VE360_08815 [Pyrinomonadaceae bacterium]|nr:hypothetical protein [Pyrinomonadaceae bacterium]
MLTKAVCFALSLLLFSATAAAQAMQRRVAPPERKEDEESLKAERELEKKAVGLLEETVREADALKLAENRVHVQMVAAGLLWPRDADAARALFKQATDGVAAMIAEGNPNDPQYQNERHAISQLRQQLVMAAAAHDAKLALDFLRATRQPPPFAYADAEHRQADQELHLENVLAAQVAAQDTKQALKMAEESLSRGVSQGLTNVFHQLAAKDKEAAARLATEIIKKLRAEDLTRDYEASSVALHLLTQTRSEAAAVAEPAAPSPQAPIVISSSKVDGWYGANAQVVIEERWRRQLVETLAAAALSEPSPRHNGVVQNILTMLQNALPEVERYAPARVAALKRRAASESRADPRGAAWREYNDLVQNGTIEAMLEAAPKVPPEVRDQLYHNAAWKAVNENNNIERARQIAENIANPERRTQTLRAMEWQHGVRAAEQGNIHDARRLIARSATVDEKVQLLLQLSTTALGRGDKATARELLEEARALVGRGENAQQFYALFGVARAYAALDEGISYEMVETAIDRLNELMAAAVVVNGFGQDAFREGELRQQGGHMWNDLVGRCAQELAALAPKNFERARSLAQRFQRTDARTTAQLLFAQNVLQSIAPRNNTNTRHIQNLMPNSRTIIIDED